VQDLVVVEVVVPDLDAGLLLEVPERVFGDVVGPVVDIEDLLLFLGTQPGGSQGQRGGGQQGGIGRKDIALMNEPPGGAGVNCRGV
jgi:hypothetical protein